MVVKLGWEARYISNARVTELEYHKFVNATREILKDKRTWHTFLISNASKYAPEYEQITLEEFVENKKNEFCRINRNHTKTHGELHMAIYFVNTEYINKRACPGLEVGSGSDTKLSCTSSPDSGIYSIYINVDNCNEPYKTAMETDEIDYSVRYNLNDQNLSKLYLQYVINHEVGHALGRGHYIPKNLDNTAKNIGFPAPVMMQQTKGLYNYEFNTWPLKEEDGNFDTTCSNAILKEFNITT